MIVSFLELVEVLGTGSGTDGLRLGGGRRPGRRGGEGRRRPLKTIEKKNKFLEGLIEVNSLDITTLTLYSRTYQLHIDTEEILEVLADLKLVVLN